MVKIFEIENHINIGNAHIYIMQPVHPFTGYYINRVLKNEKKKTKIKIN